MTRCTQQLCNNSVRYLSDTPRETWMGRVVTVFKSTNFEKGRRVPAYLGKVVKVWSVRVGVEPLDEMGGLVKQMKPENLGVSS